MLGFCSGSDRYYAVGNKPGHWSIHDAVGAHVIDVSAPVRTDVMEQAHAIRASLEAVRPAKFEVGEIGQMNLDLYDPNRESRTHVVNVRPRGKDGWEAELSDGSTVDLSIWNRETRERANP